MAGRVYDLVTWGNLSIDTIRSGGDTETMPLNGSPLICSLICAAQQLNAGVITGIPHAQVGKVKSLLASEDIDTQGIYTTDELCKKEFIVSGNNYEVGYPNSLEPVDAKQFPPEYYNCRILYFNPISYEFALPQLDRIARYGQKTVVNLGGFSNRSNDQPLEACNFFDFVVASEMACHNLFNVKYPQRWAGDILERGPGAVFLFLKNHKLLVVTPERFWEIPLEKKSPDDQIYYNEAFMAGFFCEYLRSNDILEASIFAGATFNGIDHEQITQLSNFPSEADIRRTISDGFKNKGGRRLAPPCCYLLRVRPAAAWGMSLSVTA
jgi:hypothetical protein